ncbi:hypothetical protein ACSRUE_14330 [Sorangium sp. KYC3313]|uniref:hypothetical protein n=1 Tax=Sorangium sp. KYC3313 TaxID=3449740 RepID=UPI003F8AD1D2
MRRTGTILFLSITTLTCGVDDPRICPPGSLAACFLPDGTLGAQQCASDGSAYGACGALPSPPPPAGAGCAHLGEACCPSLPAELRPGCEAAAAEGDDEACDEVLRAAGDVDLCVGGPAAPQYGPNCAGLLNGCCAALPEALREACHAIAFSGNERRCERFLEQDAKASGRCEDVSLAGESCGYLGASCCPSLPEGPAARCASVAGAGNAEECLGYLGQVGDANRCPTVGDREPLTSAACDELLASCCSSLDGLLAHRCDFTALTGSGALCDAFLSGLAGTGLCGGGGEGGAGAGCGDTDADVENCGACGNVCGTQNATPSCAAGACSLACAIGFGDCDGDASNGCEADLAQDADHCGGCGNACVEKHGTASCIAGRCALSCVEGFRDCDEDPLTGCEANVRSNPFHCGGCGNDCLGGVCEDGVCGPEATTIASGLAVPSALAVLGDHLYLAGARPQGGVAVRVLKYGLDEVACLATLAPPQDGTCGFGVFEGVAVAGLDVFVTSAEGVLKHTASDGLLLLSANVAEPWAVVADATAVWFTSRAESGVFRVDTASSAEDAVEITGTVGRAGGALVADDTHLYWAQGGGVVVKMRKDGAEQQQIASGQSFDDALTPQFLGIDAEHLFWSTESGRLMRLGKDGANLVVLADEQPAPAGIAVDPAPDGAVYWVNRGSGVVRRVNKDGSGLATLAAGQAQPIAIALDEAYVYWAAQDGAVRRTAK